MRAERLEDLGRISEKLDQLLLDFDETWGSLFSSKHFFEDFVKKVTAEDGLYDLHRYLRNFIEKLEQMSNIATGNRYDE